MRRRGVGRHRLAPHLLVSAKKSDGTWFGVCNLRQQSDGGSEGYSGAQESRPAFQSSVGGEIPLDPAQKRFRHIGTVLRRPTSQQVQVRPSLNASAHGLVSSSRSAVSASNRRADRAQSRIQAALTEIFFSALWASAVLGSLTVSTPLVKFASILSASTPSGSWNERWKEPYRRSER